MQETTTRSELRAFWSHHVERYNASELDKAAYCREHDLSYHQMVYWSGKAALAQSQPAVVTPSKPISPLVPIRVTPTTSSEGLSVRLPTGVVISGIGADNLSLLRSEISAL